ncbi:unnamed protein product, partial [Ilex paraguariensis]
VVCVLGQLQNKIASNGLSGILRDVNEHSMVRHEVAEALDSIVGLTILMYLMYILSSFSMVD